MAAHISVTAAYVFLHIPPFGGQYLPQKESAQTGLK